MSELLFELSENAKEKIKKRPHIPWSEVVEQAIEAKSFEMDLEGSRKMKQLLVEAVAAKGKLSEEEADTFAVALGRKMKKGRFEELRKMGLV